jgi:hypothetical protein
MSTDRETTRVVRSWLEEGVTALPDRVLDTVLDQLPATRQRRAWWPAWRFVDMNNTFRLGIAAVAVVVLALTAYSLLPKGPGQSGAQSPAPSTSGTPAPLPSGSMAAGTYLVSDPTLTLIPYTLTVPAGWTGGGGASNGASFGGTGVALTTWPLTHVYADPCHWSGSLVAVPTRAAAVAAFKAQTSVVHDTPVETTIGGLPATKLTISLAKGFDLVACGVNPIVRLWPDPGPDESGGWGLIPGQSTTVYVIQAGNRVMVLMTVQHQDSNPADVAALQQILASVRFQVPVPSPTTAPS